MACHLVVGARVNVRYPRKREYLKDSPGSSSPKRAMEARFGKRGDVSKLRSLRFRGFRKSRESCVSLRYSSSPSRNSGFGLVTRGM